MSEVLGITVRADHRYRKILLIEQVEARILFATNTWSATAGGD
jgi:hypothetical protein